MHQSDVRPQQTDYFTKFPHRYRKTGKRMAETSFHSESRKRKDLRFGNNDAGASVVSLFQVYRHLSTTEQAYNLIFLASCEEEVSGKNGIESVLPQLPSHSP